MGPRHLTVWNTSNLSHDNRQKYIFNDEGGPNQLGVRTHQDIPLPPRRELPASLTTNGERRLPQRGSELSDARALRAGEADSGDPPGAAAGREQENGAGRVSKDKSNL